MMGRELYNEELKREFLSEYENEGTREIYEFILSKAKETEEDLNKDLYNFTTYELELLFYDFDPFSISAINTYSSIVTTYIEWAVEKGIRSGNIELLQIQGHDWLSKFVRSDRRIYVSEHELMELQKEMENAQDAVIFQLAFEGVGGKQNSEMLNLTSNDIDEENNILYLQDDEGNSRNLQVSSHCIRLCQQALKETTYQGLNGQSSARAPVRDLVENNYVIKSSMTRTVNTGKAHPHVIYRRVDTIKTLFEYPYLRIKNIQRSGMLKIAKDYYIKHGELSNELIDEIAKRFSFSKVTIDGKAQYNRSIVRQAVNLENIFKLYDVEKATQ